MRRSTFLALFTLIFTQSAGAFAPTRIVSLAPVATEFLFALGVGDSVVGVTTYCDRPSPAQKIAKIGGFADPLLEPILNLKPDLVVATPFGKAQTTVDALNKLGIATHSSSAQSLDDTKRFLVSLGKATGRETQANQLQATFDSEFAKLHQVLSSKKPRVLLLISSSPLIAAGPATFPGEILSHLGAHNIVKTQTPAWPILPLETLLKEPPDYIVVTEGRHGEISAQTSLKALLSAHKQVRLIVPEQALLQRPGPYLIDDVKLLIKLIHESHK